MHMCRHDDGGMDQQAIPVETQQTIGNGLSYIRSGKRPRAHAGIQPGVVPFAEPAVVFLPLCLVPGLGIGLTPQGKFFIPCAQLESGGFSGSSWFARTHFPLSTDILERHRSMTVCSVCDLIGGGNRRFCDSWELVGAVHPAVRFRKWMACLKETSILKRMPWDWMMVRGASARANHRKASERLKRKTPQPKEK